MHIFTNRIYKNRDGKIVVITSTEGRDPYPVIGYLGDAVCPMVWTREGKFNTELRHRHDLTEVTHAERLMAEYFDTGGSATARGAMEVLRSAGMLKEGQ